MKSSFKCFRYPIYIIQQSEEFFKSILALSQDKRFHQSISEIIVSLFSEVHIKESAKTSEIGKKEKTANAVFSLYLSILFFANLFDNNNRKSEEDESHSPHDNTAENAAKAYAQACNNVGYSSDARNERSVGELSINVVNVVAFCTCGSKDSCIGDGRNVVAEYRTPRVAETVRIVNVPLPPRIVTAIGTRTPNVPQDVPVENAIAPARIKNIAGKRNWGNALFARLFSTNA